MDRGSAILSLIAEMQAKLAAPDVGGLTVELATLTIQNALPMVTRPQIVTTAPMPHVQPAFHSWAMDALHNLDPALMAAYRGRKAWLGPASPTTVVPNAS